MNSTHLTFEYTLTRCRTPDNISKLQEHTAIDSPEDRRHRTRDGRAQVSVALSSFSRLRFFSLTCTPLLLPCQPCITSFDFFHKSSPLSRCAVTYTDIHQACARHARAAFRRQEVLSHDQWRSDGADGQGSSAYSKDQLGWLEERAGRAGQAVQVKTGRHGEVEGTFPCRDTAIWFNY
jgi:hypothetical protein